MYYCVLQWNCVCSSCILFVIFTIVNSVLLGPVEVTAGHIHSCVGLTGNEITYERYLTVSQNILK